MEKVAVAGLNTHHHGQLTILKALIVKNTTVSASQMTSSQTSPTVRNHSVKLPVSLPSMAKANSVPLFTAAKYSARSNWSA